jgi:hypothetical protein
LLACSFAQLTNAGELLARHAHHAQVANLAPPAQVKKTESYHADLLVGARCTTPDEAGGVFTSANLRVSLAWDLLRGIIVHTIKTLGGAMMSVDTEIVI